MIDHGWTRRNKVAIVVENYYRKINISGLHFIYKNHKSKMADIVKTIRE